LLWLLLYMTVERRKLFRMASLFMLDLLAWLGS
jgi:hypothetical protein